MSADPRRRWWRSAIAATAMGVVLIATADASATSAAAQDQPADVATTSVAPTEGWTSTGIFVRAGDEIAIRASGTIRFGQPPIDQMEPTGLAWGPECEVIAGSGAQWFAPGLNCYSLIGRIGSERPFNIGNAASFEAAVDGEVMLATNDDNFGDNSGAWSAVVTPPRSSTPTAANESGAPANQSRGVLIVALIGVAAAAALIALMFARRRARREPAFDLPESLRVARIDVRVARDRTLWRVDRAGDEHPFVPFASDFTALGVEGRHETFVWRGLEFRAEPARVRFARPYGEVVLPGEYVAASAGMTLSPGGRTHGLLPLALDGAWVFTLVSVDTDAEATNTSAHGHITMFVRDDAPLRAQADRIVASLRAFLDDLDRMLAEREARQTDDAGSGRIAVPG